MSEPPRILVVDDEPYIADLVTMGLRYQGYDVETVGAGRPALAAAAKRHPDLVILDVMLPDLDGFEVCRRMRADGIDAPVIFLTAKDAITDRVEGLSIGGDDYVTKPFSLEELAARVRAVLRRVGPPAASRRIEVADLVLDDDSHEVTRGGEVIDLTPTEYKLLHYLMANHGRALSKAQILDHVWEYDFGGDANVVETYVSYLRRKLDRHGPTLIQTVRGVGYSLRPARPS
ncbi:MAG: response regulator transcription factor [Acidimicrobiales bacterium]